VSGVCGIVFCDRHQLVNAIQLRSMVRSLDMIGRDASEMEHCESAGLGAQRFPGRLAGVIKVIRNETCLAMAFHGTIYNLRELVTSSAQDADILHQLLSIYQSESTAFINRIRGEFALGIWDGSVETLYLATDRFRVHPLFYYCDGHKFLFSSRMKGISAYLLPPERNLNPRAVVDLIASSYIPTPNTIFTDVKKLPPGHLLSYRDGAVNISPYWELDFTQSSSKKQSDLAGELREELSESISIRLQSDFSDRGVGTFLSGGVDSSTVTGLLSRIAKAPIKSFSIGFDEQRFNEINYARIAAKAFGVEHHEYFVTPADVIDAIPLLIDSFDEPFANASAVPTYYCAKLAREHGVDFLYAGDGGDELFAGNERYATQRLFDYYQDIPVWLRRGVVEPAMFTLADTLKWNLLVKAKKYICRSNVPYPERLSSYGVFKIISPKEWFEDDFLAAAGSNYDPYGAVDACYFKAPASAELDRQLYIDLKLAISDNDLFKVTRMTEAAGVAVRYPFLDHHLAEFAARVPAHLKMSGLNLRTFFKKAYSHENETWIWAADSRLAAHR
jgi:asparagine synthase (glutamine-hydrolysing)